MIVTNAEPNPYGWRYVVDGRPVVTLSKDEQAAYDKVTAEQRKAAFLADLRDVLRKHDVALVSCGCGIMAYIGGYNCPCSLEVDMPYEIDALILAELCEKCG